jgi:hypothetical protein
LEQAAHWSEDLYDRAKASDWSGAKTALVNLRQALANLEQRYPTDADVLAARAHTDEIETAIRATNPQALAESANAVTRDVAQLAKTADPASLVPADVTLLDYYGRELEIWSAQKDLARLKATAKAAEEVWQRLAQRITDAGGKAERTRFDGLMKRLGAARTVDDFRALATPILDEVDSLENVFKTKAAPATTSS